MDPMLATPGPLPVGPQWAFEAKFDGIRLIATLRDATLRATSRNGKDLSRAFPELQQLAAALAASGVRSATLDGELVARGDGRPPRLQQIAPRIHRTSADAATQARHPVTYMVFDITELDGRDLTALPYDERRRTLTAVVGDGPAWHCSDVFDDGPALWRATAESGFEGVVAKRRDSRYSPGVRSRDWIKTVHRARTDLVVVGWRPETGGRSRVGALVLAGPGPDGLAYAGSAGSGMTQALSDVLTGVWGDLARATPPIPVPPGTQAHWLEPLLVVTVEHLGHTEEGNVRQPVIIAVRPDLTAADLETRP